MNAIGIITMIKDRPCSTCSHCDFLYGVKAIDQCHMENMYEYNLGYPESGKGVCEYYSRMPGSDDDKEN